VQARSPTTLTFAAGELVVRGWPDGVAAPPLAVVRADGSLRGPARLRGSVRRTLAAAGVPFVDGTAPPPAALPAAAPAAPMLAALLRSCGSPAAGVLVGLALEVRGPLVHAAAERRSAPALVVVPDTGAVASWHRELAPRLGAALGEHRGTAGAVTLATAAAAAADIGWLGGRHELLVVDTLELIQPARLAAVVDGSAALHRLGFAASAADCDLMQRGIGIGPVVAVHEPGAAPPCVELRLPLSVGERDAYEAAWHEFFAAFDRFGAMRPGAAFGDFVRWARGDETGRPGLLAWHRSLRAASWTEAKQGAVAMLLERHRGARVLLFTPDCETAYALARQHLVMPVTAELPRRERDAALLAFARGELRVLAGPRLLETGTPEGSADAGVLIGCSLGRAQRRARAQRVAATGVVYELVSLDTLEVGRAGRMRGTAAAAAVALD
jgi:hypothetical protein